MATISSLVQLGNARVAQVTQRFFKRRDKAGDQFLDIRVPVLKVQANNLADGILKDARDTVLEVALPLLKSGWHEARARVDAAG